MPSASDYIENVRKYAKSADEEIVGKIVKHLGIALQSKDASLVSCSDKSELDRVREKWLKKKLALSDGDAALDGAISEVCQTMAAERQKQRVTFYYLLAEKYGKLGDL